MMVFCSFSSLVRVALWLVALALVAGLALAGTASPATSPATGPDSGPVPTSTRTVAAPEPVDH